MIERLRAALVGGPDVWEVVRSLVSARSAEPGVSEEDLLAMLEDNTGVPQRLVRAALDYWSAYPAEVDAFVSHADQLERDLESSAGRVRSLLAP